MASCGSMKHSGMTKLTVRGGSDGTMCVVAGRYESWFLSARDVEPGRPPRALWIRHTRHRYAGSEDEAGALWCPVSDPAAGGGPAAVKESRVDDGAVCGLETFRGGARPRGRMAEWDLSV